MRLALRTVVLTFSLWLGLFLVQKAWYHGSGNVGAFMEQAGTAGRLALYFCVAAVAGIADRALQGNGEMARGALAGMAGWAAGGLVLYGPWLFSSGPMPLVWNTAIGGVATSGFIFSGISAVAGMIVGLVQGLVQTSGPEGAAWRKRHWVVWSAIGGALAWALVPIGTLSAG